MSKNKKNKRKTSSATRSNKNPATLRDQKELARAEKLLEQKEFSSAEHIAQKILQKDPGHPQALGVQGQIYYRQGDFERAIACQKKALTRKPDDPIIYYNLGVFLGKCDRLDEALDAYQQTLKLNPKYINALNNMGAILHKRRDLDGAITALKKIVDIQPDFGPAHLNLGEIYSDKGDFNRAIAAYEKGLELLPDSPNNLNNLGILYRKTQRGSMAIAAFQKAINLDPGQIAAYNNLGSVYMDLGLLNEAFSNFRKSLALDNTYFLAITNLLFCLNYPTDLPASEIFAEHKKWGHIIDQEGAAHRRSHSHLIQENRKIRIGYVSPDFRRHAVANFIEPILTAHNRDTIEIVCYFNGPHPDNKTLQLKNMANKWRDIFHHSDLEVASLIENDQIDILVDLAGHTAHSRLEVFAMKPAPIQVTYLGYPNTTGMTTIDYRLTDNQTDPEGKSEHLHTEKLVRLPDCFLCYGPPSEPVTVNAPAVQKNGHITFASFNNRPKINDQVISCWARILKKVPDAKLLIKSVHLSDKEAANHLLRKFTDLDIAPNRIDIRGALQSYTEHLQLYNEVDIALDTFPYNGTTTTFEALWMGVPVIAIKGETHVSRVSSSILRQVNLENFAVANQEEYVALAISLANDLEQLTTLRHTLRSTLEASPACDAERFTENLERAYGHMVATWNQQFQATDAQAGQQKVCATSEEFRTQGEQLFKANQFAEAKKALQKAIELDPNNEIALNNLGVVLWQDGDTQGALTSFQKAIAAKPDYINAIDNLAALINSADDKPAGQSAQPPGPARTTSPLVQFGLELLNQKKYAEAAQAFEKAIQANPADDTAYNNLGVLHWQTGNLHGAITNLSQAIKINPTGLEAINNLKTVFQKLGKTQGEQHTTVQTASSQEGEHIKQPDSQPVRIVHQLARSGGTLISKCLGCMQDVVMLSEIHPQGGTWFNPLQQAQQWYQLFTPAEMTAINRQKDLNFRDTIDLIYRRCLELNRPLVIRDWSHLDFMAAPFLDSPSYDFSINNALAEKFEIVEFATTRHPIDQWLSLSKLAIMKDKLDLDQFLYGYKKFAEQCRETGFMRYEDFINDPQNKMRELCSKLSLVYDPGFIDKWWRYDKMTGDTQSIRGDKKEIKRVPRYPISDKLLMQFVNNKHYHDILKILGYRHPE